MPQFSSKQQTTNKQVTTNNNDNNDNKNNIISLSINSMEEITKEEREILKNYVIRNKLAKSSVRAYVNTLIKNGDYKDILISEKDAKVLGGKTGYTTESGQSVIVLFKKNNRSYILMVANAMGNPYNEEFYHFEDAIEIINNLY